MAAKINLIAIAAAAAVLTVPMLASAMVVRDARHSGTPVVVSPEGRVLGTDPSAAVRFELNRDSSRGR